MMTGRLAMMQLSTMRRCAVGIASAGSSTPRSPRATMMPYDASMMSSRLSRPSWFSIFEMILILLERLSRISCTAFTSSALRTNEWAMKSMSFSVAHSMKARSRSVTDGRAMDTPGMLTLLRGRSVASPEKRHRSSSPFFSMTRNSISPSEIRRRSPTLMLGMADVVLR